MMGTRGIRDNLQNEGYEFGTKRFLDVHIGKHHDGLGDGYVLC